MKEGDLVIGTSGSGYFITNQHTLCLVTRKWPTVEWRMGASGSEDRGDMEVEVLESVQRGNTQFIGRKYIVKSEYFKKWRKN